MPRFSTYIVTICGCLLAMMATAQDKGLSPAASSILRNTGTTRALVVGISDYQYIDDLNYAHTDAEKFAGFLYDQDIPAGEVVVLTNKEARHANILTELVRLAQLSQAGDMLIFYFSGHGDVENITMFKKGYLLTYDTYSNNYMAGGLSVNDLRDISITLCDRQVNVMVITDACRSGKLAGGEDGVKYTAGLLKDTWKNEVKLLSSQPNQLSKEGTQWGNGRGVFSWYLVNGLEGLADENRDSLITINELEDYVEKNVARETKGEQQPIIEGPNPYTSVLVNLKQYYTKKRSGGGNSSGQPKTFRVPVDSCSIYLSKMEEAIGAKRFEGETNSAINYYQKIRQCTNDRSLILSANSRLLSGMMNEAQEIVNHSFSGRKLVSTRECEYADRLLGYVLHYNDLQLPYAKSVVNLQRYLRVVSGVMSWSSSAYPELTRILDSATSSEPDAAYLTLARGIVELRHGNYTRATEILEKATRQGPGWLMPKFYLGITYGYKREFRKALDYYEEVLRSDSNLKSFECAECIEARMKEYRKRVERIRFDKYGKDRRLAELDSLRSHLADNMDSAYFYHEMAGIANKKNHPKRDSVFYFLTQAVTLDLWENDYIYSLFDYMDREFYGQQEKREWAGRILSWRDDDDTELVIYLNEIMIYSFILTKEHTEATRLVRKLIEDEYYRCSDLKKLKKHLSKDPGFVELLENCGME